jgi:isopropylmalate/homocitrate/citramalate synthase
MVFEYASLKGDNGGMRTEVITEIADYYREVIGYKVPENAPFVGANFNMTRAGIHADGLMKDEEIYNIFDTRKLLNKAPQVEIGPSSGAAGLAYWINRAYSLSGDKAVKKTDELVCTLKKWVDEQYAGGRQTMMTEHELETKIFFLSEGKLTR